MVSKNPTCLQYCKRVLESCKSVLQCKYELLTSCLGKRELPIVGIDPGETCGLVLRLRNFILYSWEGPKSDLVDVTGRILNEVRISKMFIGNGHLTSNMGVIVELIKLASEKSVALYLVDEPNTTRHSILRRYEVLETKHKLGKHAYAALLISRKVNALRIL